MFEYPPIFTYDLSIPITAAIASCSVLEYILSELMADKVVPFNCIIISKKFITKVGLTVGENVDGGADGDMIGLVDGIEEGFRLGTEVVGLADGVTVVGLSEGE